MSCCSICTRARARSARLGLLWASTFSPSSQSARFRSIAPSRALAARFAPKHSGEFRKSPTFWGSRPLLRKRSEACCVSSLIPLMPRSRVRERRMTRAEAGRRFLFCGYGVTCLCGLSSKAYATPPVLPDVAVGVAEDDQLLGGVEVAMLGDVERDPVL